MARSISRVVLWCILLPLAAATAGCQRGSTWNLAPVEGTLTKEGRPLANIRVAFLVDLKAGTLGPQASGITDEAGHYRLRTDHGDEGAVVGKHRVVLFDLEVAQKQTLRSLRKRQRNDTEQLSPEIAKRLEEQLKPTGDVPRVPPRYGRFNETPLRVEVHPGPQVIDLEVQ
jgi:hypothetical protein